MISWTPLLLRSKKVLACCHRSTKLRYSGGLLASLLSCRLSCIPSFTWLTGRKLASLSFLLACSHTGCGRAPDLHLQCFMLDSALGVCAQLGLWKRDVPVSSTSTAVLQATCLNGILDNVRKPTWKLFNLDPVGTAACLFFFLCVFLFVFFCSACWASTSSVGMLCDPGTTAQHIPWTQKKIKKKLLKTEFELFSLTFNLALSWQEFPFVIN